MSAATDLHPVPPIRAQAAKVERQLRAEVELERNRLRDVLAQAPAPMALVSGSDHQFTFVNATYTKVSGRDHDQLIGKPIRIVFPEFAGQGIFELLDRVYQSGETYFTSGREVKIFRRGAEEKLHFDFTCFPMRNLKGVVYGILFHGVDVTQSVLAQSLLEIRVKERAIEVEKVQQRLRMMKPQGAG